MKIKKILQKFAQVLYCRQEKCSISGYLIINQNVSRTSHNKQLFDFRNEI